MPEELKRLRLELAGMRRERSELLLEISKQALHRPLLDLARMGLVTKSRDATDGRLRIIVLTAAGRSLERRLSEPQR